LDSTINGKRFQVVMEMLDEQHPMRFVETASVTPSTAEKKLGMIEGYELAIARIKLCTKFQPLQGPMPPATFEAPQTEE
jgi:putative component of membrane protein insertase Oxa1/YidC/SpoIIIJ protein YidD